MGPISRCIILETREVISVEVDCSPVRLPLAPIDPRGFGKESMADINIPHAFFDPCETFDWGVYFEVDTGCISVIKAYSSFASMRTSSWN
jgi:hypothetical protein